MANNGDFDSALSRALANTAQVCNDLAEANVLSERTLTGAVLGALKASILMQAGPDIDLAWAIYNEGPAGNDYSEGATGVDFGLLLVGETGVIRFTVFQAKRPNNVPRTHIRANRVRMENGRVISQLLTLRDDSLKLMRACKSGEVIEQGDLKWVHYLAYCNPIRSIPLSSMEKQIKEEEEEHGSSQSFDATDLGSNFDIVLTSGAMMNSVTWLTIGSVSGNPPIFSSRQKWS